MNGTSCADDDGDDEDDDNDDDGDGDGGGNGGDDDHHYKTASLDEAIEHQNAQVPETILRSKADALLSENDVVLVRLSAHDPEVKRLMPESEKLKATRNRVARIFNKLSPAWAKVLRKGTEWQREW